MTTARAEDRAENGALWLDEVHPGWWAEIDSENLNILSAEFCVLGQLVGYDRMISRHHLSPVDIVNRGFAPGPGLSLDNTILTAAWRVLIEKRRANAGQLAGAAQ